MEKPIRTFIAIELPAAVIQLAAALQSELKAQGLKLRWVRPQNMHLTLRFLGEISPGRAADAAVAMRRAACAVQPLELCVQGMGVFPGMRRPRIVWIGVGGQTEGLQKLHAHLEEALAALDFPREERPFTAHLTLARMERAVDSQRLMELLQRAGGFEPAGFAAPELILFRSDLRPQGPVYTPLARAPLGRG